MFGIDRLMRDERLLTELRGRRIGLLAHPASVDRSFQHVSALLEARSIRPTVIWGPEHGYGGEAQDMVGVADARTASGTRIISLYGDDFSDLSPKPEDLRAIDVLVIDLADVGSRYYTFVWTALLAVESAAALGVESLILDRPNPLGRTLEGALQEPGFLSFVGLRPVPVRHGMTLGELVALFHAEGSHSDVPLRIVRPTPELDALGRPVDRPFVMTSPNMPTLETALVYPGGCLLEGTNLSDGRGTTRPFEITGAPFLDGEKLARDLRATELPGFIPRPLTFLPTFHKHAKILCGGVQIHVTDAATFRPYATYLALVALAFRNHPKELRFRIERYEFVDTIPAFDLLTGSAAAREAIVAVRPLSEWLDDIARPPASGRERQALAIEAADRCAVRG